MPIGMAGICLSCMALEADSRGDAADAAAAAAAVCREGCSGEDECEDDVADEWDDEKDEGEDVKEAGDSRDEDGDVSSSALLLVVGRLRKGDDWYNCSALPPALALRAEGEG
jgi:hypothetical protein